jgi:prepilin-type N-terminal cleavage/methylation domain-containing protein
MSGRSTSKGFTLLEMTLAMAITAITGLSVAVATVALSRAHEDTEGFYQSLQTARSAMMRIQRAVQGAKLVTACSGPMLVLWFDDANANGKIDADEVLVVVFDTAAEEVRFCQKVFPAGVHDALNVEVPLYDLLDASAVVSNVTSSAYAQTMVVATDTSGFFAAASPAPPMSKRVDLTLSVGDSKNAITLRSSATPRGGKTGRVAIVDGKYVVTAD